MGKGTVYGLRAEISYSVTIFTSAFLLFQIQPIVAKIILPWFGGSAAVWTTCMLFYQGGLLLGYLYSDRLVTWLKPKRQILIHIAILVFSFVFMPIAVAGAWKPSTPAFPVLRIVGLLAATVGLPYFLLSTTNPLIQSWYARSHQGARPYRLYALSNAGSMLGLLSYPILVEPLLPVRHQLSLWSLGYALFGISCALSAFGSWKGFTDADRRREESASSRPAWSAILLWIALAATASTLLLAVTNHLTQDVAPVPFLWVLPLSLYLLSFIICFSGEGQYYWRKIYLLLLPLFLFGMVFLKSDKDLAVAVGIPVFAVGLLVCCMVCHGELYRRRPDAAHLTLFYLMVSVGGVLGGLFVGLFAPYAFNDYYELPLGLALCALLAFICIRGDMPIAGSSMRAAAVTGGAALLVAAFCGYLIYEEKFLSSAMRLRTRSFYGVTRVGDFDVADPAVARRKLVHGRTVHGRQFLHPLRRRQPTAYFAPWSGVGLTLIRNPEQQKRVGAIGLGAGTIAAYGRPGDVYRFYEINPDVIDVARNEFFFLTESEASIELVPGDGRLTLEREADQQFDVLVLDAFSGSATPVHLLTREAFELYFRHVKEDGIIAVNILNNYLELELVIERVVSLLGKHAVMVRAPGDETNLVYPSQWVLISSRPEVFQQPPFLGRGEGIASRTDLQVWTDDYSNLFQILKFFGK